MLLHTFKPSSPLAARVENVLLLTSFLKVESIVELISTSPRRRDETAFNR